MKPLPLQTDSPHIHSITSCIAEIIEAPTLTSLRGTKLNKVVSRLTGDLQRLSGATSISVILTGDDGTVTRFFSSSGNVAIHSDTSLRTVRDAIDPSQVTKRRAILKKTSRNFPEMKEVVFGDVEADSISLYPLRYGTKPLGILVAAFGNADGQAERGSASDQLLEAAATQLSLFSFPSDER